MDKINIDNNKIQRTSQQIGEKVNSLTTSLVQFATDSIGLAILKQKGDKDLAYKVIKTGREIAKTAGMITGTTVKTGGAIVSTLANKQNIEKVKETATKVTGNLKDKVVTTMEQTENDYKKSEEFNDVKNKISRLLKEKIDMAQNFKDEVLDKADNLKYEAQFKVEEVKEMASNTISTDKIEEVREKVSNKVNELFNEAKEKTSEIKNKTEELTKDTFSNANKVDISLIADDTKDGQMNVEIKDGIFNKADKDIKEQIKEDIKSNIENIDTLDNQ